VIDVGTDINSPSVKVHVSTPDQHGEYVCLSYCWGGSQAVTATRKTIQAIQNSIPLNSLGQTIQDAIETTRSLGFRYLWVDALCIIQDDDQDKIVEINKMASIYKNAVVTIAAAVSASSYEGFLRRDRTLRRKRCDFRFAMPDGAIGNIALAPERRYVPTHPIDRRAWTFQEFILSSRILMYSDFELLWDCETQQHQPLRKSVMSYSFSQSPRWFPQMLKRIIREGSSGTHPQWADIVSNYATRAMTDPEDRLNALAGVAHEFAQLLEDDYIFGMWRKKIIHHLGWQSLDPNSRRSPRAPSWSWACLDGGVDFFHYSTVAKLSAKTPDEDPRKLVLVCKVIPAHEVRGSQYNKVFNDLSIEEADDTRKFYMLLGENPPSEAAALVLMEVDQDLYKRIGLLNYADLKSWAKCKKREITLI
jgi:hypothetical protein